MMDNEDSRTKARLVLGVLDGLAAMAVGASRKGIGSESSRDAKAAAAAAVHALTSHNSSSALGRFKGIVKRVGRCARSAAAGGC